RDILEGVGYQVHHVELDAPFGVRDDGGGQLVHSRITSQAALHQLGQFTVVAAAQALPNLAQLVTYNVEVVQKPVACRADVHVVRGDARKAFMRPAEDRTRFLKPREKRGS